MSNPFGSPRDSIPKVIDKAIDIGAAVALVQQSAALAADVSTKVEFTRPPAEPSHLYRVRHGESLSELIEAKPAPRNHRLHDLDAVIAFCRRWGTERTVIWLGEKAVVVHVDDATRRDRATLPLRFTSTFETIRKLSTSGQSKKLLQPDFVRLLRIDLAGTHLSHPNLIQKFRNVRASANTATSGQIEHGSEAFSREATAKVTGADLLPEQVTLNTAVYLASLTHTVDITCEIEIDASAPAFAMTPTGDQIEKAIADTLAAFADEMQERLDNEGKSFIAVILGDADAGG